jgi:hypothetical protein
LNGTADVQRRLMKGGPAIDDDIRAHRGCR